MLFFSNIGVEGHVIPFCFEDLLEGPGPLLFDGLNKKGCSPSLVLMFRFSGPILKKKNPKDS